MRIVAGDWRGRRLAAVGKGDAGAHLRPTTDRVREALFNMLAGGRFGDPFDGTRVLDLFAGTGALGLEALSRGAATAVFVDDGRVAGKLIRENIKTLGCADRARLIAHNATRLPAADAPCDLVFLDPPYGKALGTKALLSAQAGGWIAPGALVVWEEQSPQEAPGGFDPLDTRRYGDTHVTLLRAQEPDAPS
ncbi:16S rRNA (guanine(966)-N(2))-methyltransferase RsmD [Mameliella sediminis]|uniref:16S rRNA (guanine(966)-N(2))-methyltransferase RsmD n=1 Tax=Mameliella sediminis TaxID=2836866 RepID=UPI001C45DDA2|nr:16S rRNA (guanine(966)-N(2))-methyltransferase RsmD [Mameliella sediminis]MBY6113142.1 16S rRNA (guanine(966)-N(2))-methyltransferase RsmD [Antarctobacter heliothermus]MBY6143510.1 16S rRNA (guanine(966)-N(2))-methyltransferase RsmD [Mameliella alba]MBY6162590.1 16S rRNA (guanine(966)-N(2))-methyltransferase RsmD [Mameliella alba]MBY6171949.1 16S rRNA (guanine(966)-N(2))-methyltransferase RsmD [Mameliella alba]